MSQLELILSTAGTRHVDNSKPDLKAKEWLE
jgi:hypothetical protein